eukprot:gene10894-12697_t
MENSCAIKDAAQKSCVSQCSKLADAYTACSGRVEKIMDQDEKANCLALFE